MLRFEQKEKINNLLARGTSIFIWLLLGVQIIPLRAQDMGQLAMRARINLYEKWNFDSVEYYFSRTISKKYTPAFTYSDYGWYLWLKGRKDEGLKEIRKSVQMDPDYVQLISWYSWALLWNNDITGAEKWINKALNLDPNDGEALHVACRVALEMKDFEEALRLAKLTASNSLSWRGILPLVYAHTGKVAEAKELAKKFADEEQPFDDWLLMETYVQLEMDEKALEFLQKAFDNRYPFLPWLNLAPGIDRLHHYALFKEIIDLLDLPSN